MKDSSFSVLLSGTSDKGHLGVSGIVAHILGMRLCRNVLCISKMKVDCHKEMSRSNLYSESYRHLLRSGLEALKVADARMQRRF